MILEVDMGNTRLKWRIRNGQDILVKGFIGIEEPLEQLIDRFEFNRKAISAVFVASVVGEKLELRFESWSVSALGLTPEFARAKATSGLVRNGYREPSLLGVDRWLAIIAAYRNVNGACIVISCGTAVTLDLVGPSGGHMGGFIAPGLGLMLASLSSGARQIKVSHPLPALSLSPATATAEAVYSGCAAMLTGFINNGVQQMHMLNQHSHFEIILTGGDASKLMSFYPQARLVPDLVLDGLAYALEYPE